MTDKRVSQVVTEVTFAGSPGERVSQVVTEVVYEGTPSERASQVVTEVVYVIGAAPAPARPLGRSYVIG